MDDTTTKKTAAKEGDRLVEHVRRIIKFLEEPEEVVDGMSGLVHEYFLRQKISPSTPLSRLYRDVQHLVALVMIAQMESTMARMSPGQPTWRVGQP